MTVIDSGPRSTRPGLAERLQRRMNDLVASSKFQSWAARFPLTRGIARRDGERLMDLVAGFAHSQVLQALVSLRILDHLRDRSRNLGDLSQVTQVPADRLQRLCNAASALNLLSIRPNGDIALARLGAALNGVPGLKQMILHHEILYRDLADPAAFFRSESEPELAGFWPYVFGAGREVDPEQAALYSDLMAQSQALVAEETLKAVPLADAEVLLDVGGGTGAFLTAAGQCHAHLKLKLFDLAGVADAALERFSSADLSDRAETVVGNFQTDPLPTGADTISLVRVLYDHQDDVVRKLLSKCFDTLPLGGRLIISEPMSGDPKPDRAGDAYFALYCLAMGTGTVRKPSEIKRLLLEAGFKDISVPKMHRRFITQTILARKLD